ncbi:hypothetical protein GobsT_05450 [Gemmata obscuriglobus]|uniref:CHAP domain-containing protein n=1 Tax=Gemmata obscuriglobus TaxID=114 RepID=A0A2Z3H7S4_9BACT|nr:CHAP domain-containing protein [Gemmata obscuriglobus]AWM40891.1 CHAP domain-containing protein [Gemmata obscuriglobus]QEG25810.1 hypothetical protein GobsT_05450 [Gemmata obscuriglobus]VTR99709.1 Hypothetical conserved protein OS=uncultured planctomycete GN=HGMM_F37F03C16 PE=4 SV=1 [Gemmata obscuriglobus UQM 2246]
MNSTEHFERFFFLVTVGAGLMLFGCANLALGWRGGMVVLRTVLGAAGCGAAVAALGTLTHRELAERAAAILAAALVVVNLFSSGWFHRRLAAAGALLRKPAARGAGLVVAGLAVVIGAAVWFDFADQQLTEDQTLDLEVVLGRQPNRPTERASATTDRGTPVVLKEPQSPRAPETLSSPEERLLRDTKLDDQVIRHAGPSDEFNCHGWVFTGGKFLLSPDDVELILKENGYAEVAQPQPGDVVVYRNNGTVSHTALVRYVAEGQPVLVEGKWGTMGLFLHPVDKSPYGTALTYHRSARRGHLLTGIGGAGSDAAVNAAVE